MKMFLTAAALSALVAVPVQAATSGFLSDVASGTTATSISGTINGLNYTATGYTLNDDRSNEQQVLVRYKNGSFGVKGVTGTGGDDPSGNPVQGGQNTIDGIGIDMNELLRLTFDVTVNLKQLSFKGLDDFDDVFVALTGQDGIRYSNQPDGKLENFQSLIGTSFDIMAGFPNPDFPGQVAGGDTDKFALSGADVSPVPLPAALPMLAFGMGALGFVSRRRKSATTA